MPACGLQEEIVDTQTGEVKEPETLVDERYPWRSFKRDSLQLSHLYELAGYAPYAKRERMCSTSLQFSILANGKKKLGFANFCQLRLCPMCMARRARKTAWQLSRVLDYVQAEHPDVVYIFLTITMRNCQGDDLGDTLDKLLSGWHKLLQHRDIARVVRGWFRALETTRSDKKGYHPHIHAILAVEPSYFSKNRHDYISHSAWVDHWQQALGVDYKPSVRIEICHAKGAVSGSRAAATEAAKYTVKGSDYIDPRLSDKAAAEIVRTYTEALFRRRLVAFGGWLKEAAKALKVGDLDNDKDLVHIDDDALRDDVVELIENYRWSFGAADYILCDRRPAK